jgi:hypothetical protein
LRNYHLLAQVPLKVEREIIKNKQIKKYLTSVYAEYQKRILPIKTLAAVTYGMCWSSDTK